MFTSVVVPLDGSPTAEAALGPAHDLAGTLGVPVVLFRSFWTEEEEARQYLEAIAEKITDAPTEVVARHGFASTELAKAMAERPGGLLCLTTRGHGGIGGLLVGSVADEILRTVPGPTVIVGPSCSPFALSALRHTVLLMGFDGSEGSAAALPTVRDLAASLGMAVQIVCVAHHDGQLVDDRPLARVVTDADALAAELQADGVPTTVAFLDGLDVARTLTEYAEQRPAALVAVAGTAHPGLVDTVLGGISLRLCRRSTVPVVLVRTRR